MSAVIEYHTLYKLADGSPFTLNFALGLDMTVNSILGLPSIIEADIQTKWKEKIVISHTFRMKFALDFQVTRRSGASASSNLSTALTTATNEFSPFHVSPQFQSAFSSNLVSSDFGQVCPPTP